MREFISRNCIDDILSVIFVIDFFLLSCLKFFFLDSFTKKNIEEKSGVKRKKKCFEGLSCLF